MVIFLLPLPSFANSDNTTADSIVSSAISECNNLLKKLNYGISFDKYSESMFSLDSILDQVISNDIVKDSKDFEYISKHIIRIKRLFGITRDLWKNQVIDNYEFVNEDIAFAYIAGEYALNCPFEVLDKQRVCRISNLKRSAINKLDQEIKVVQTALKEGW